MVDSTWLPLQPPLSSLSTWEADGLKTLVSLFWCGLPTDGNRSLRRNQLLLLSASTQNFSTVWERNITRSWACFQPQTFFYQLAKLLMDLTQPWKCLCPTGCDLLCSAESWEIQKLNVGYNFFLLVRQSFFPGKDRVQSLMLTEGIIVHSI